MRPPDRQRTCRASHARPHTLFSIRSHWPVQDRLTSAPALVGGVVKTVRNPNETYADCRRKGYAYVPAWSFEYFLHRERAFHAYWDNMTQQTHAVVNVPYEDLARPRELHRHLMVLREHFFPEITSSSASHAVAMFPSRATPSKRL